MKSLQERVDERIREWGVVVQTTRETPSSHLVFGTRGDRWRVLKVIREMVTMDPGGDVLHAFAGRGTVRVYEYTEGCDMQERLQPAVALAETALNGADEQATGIIADVFVRCRIVGSAGRLRHTVLDWERNFSTIGRVVIQIAGELVQSR